MSKKQAILFVVFTIFLVFLGSVVVSRNINNKLKTLGISIESRMGNQADDIKKASVLAIQDALVETIALAKKSVVNITISKDLKFYADDPSQLNGPGTIQQQTAKVG